MAMITKSDTDKVGVSVDETKYRGMIGSLLYLITSSLDIMFNVGMCACFQSKPKESHLKNMKWILRYIKGTMNLVL